MTRPSEDDLIARYFAPLAGEGAFGLRDDAACISPRPGYDLVLTTDSLVESVHFLPDDAPGSIARKALGVNVSDLAAKGAEPRGFLLNLMLPENWTEDWLSEFVAGLGTAAGGFLLRAPRRRHGEDPWAPGAGDHGFRRGPSGADGAANDGPCGGCDLRLGDHRRCRARTGLDGRPPAWLPGSRPMTRPSSPIAISTRGRAIGWRRRFGSMRAPRWMSRTALRGTSPRCCWQAAPRPSWTWRRCRPRPAARKLVDVDGALLHRMVTGGDDYEILCTVPPTRLDMLRKEADRVGIPIAVIGQVVPGDDRPVFRLGGVERRYDVGSYAHF